MPLRITTLIVLLAALTMPLGGRADTRPDFSGTWKQSNERCVPKRSGNVTLRIDHQDPHLSVETTILRPPAPPRFAIQKYTTDGKESVTTGADEDEFHTSVIWSGADLVFTIEEHEDGRILHSQETWSLIENGTTLQRVRRRSDSGEEQTLVYLR